LKFESRLTNIMSDTLDFDLEPEIYGTGMPRSGSHSAGPSMRNASRIDRVNIEEHHKIGDKLDLTKGWLNNNLWNIWYFFIICEQF
jgi:hypothetical protein